MITHSLTAQVGDVPLSRKALITCVLGAANVCSCATNGRWQ